ncbi:MAG TPA: YceH family protein [Phycisphaerae bacterium]|nr:YceH family protein [Phycisphaerales bacterium]HNO78025.1 YceH family protein [Phycisphaerae bacterium]
MHTSLDSLERRVLGSLLEKSMAQPDYYPMTEKAIVAACNQKQNRDPVMDLDEGAVWETLESLREKGLVTMLLPGAGARTKRYKHEVEQHYGWQKRERAVMTELLLRGPQTPGELRSRCSRFVPFDDIAAVTIVLECLANAETPMVRALPREPGRSAIRHAHLLYTDDDDELPTITTEEAPVRAVSAPASPQVAPKSEAIEQLQNEVADLRSRVEALESQFNQLMS